MKRLILVILTLIFYSCAKEEFVPPTSTDTTTISEKKSGSSQSCAQFTYVRPPVDLLFLWDNSTSSIYLNDQTKAALNSVINHISERFDYNVMMAPLLGTGNSNTAFFSRSGHNPGSGITTINKSYASSYLSQLPRVQGSQESGAQRAIDLIRTNQTNGVFRPNAYTLVITMSNDDDNSWEEDGCSYCFNPGRQTRYAKAKAHDLLCMRGNYDNSTGLYDSEFSTFNSSCSNAPKLDSTMMRYISISALFDKNSCSVSSQLTQNYVYKAVSEYLYSTPYTNGFTPPPAVVVNPEEHSDHFNICRGNFAYLFDGVNNAIQDAVIAHVYKYWPITSDTSTEIDPASLEVVMSNGSTFTEIPDSVSIVRDSTGKNDMDSSGNPISGYRIINSPTTVNTRFLPTAGESFTGRVIELFGDAKVTYPACLLVNYSEPDSYYGYVHLADKPNESTIVLKINGQIVPQGGANGWELVKSGGQPQWMSNFNIRIQGRGDYTPKTPALSKSGYFLKVYGNAVYSNKSTVQVTYRDSN